MNSYFSRKYVQCFGLVTLFGLDNIFVLMNTDEVRSANLQNTLAVGLICLFHIKHYEFNKIIIIWCSFLINRQLNNTTSIQK